MVMDNNLLTVRYANASDGDLEVKAFSVSSEDVQRMDLFKSWVLSYDRGSFDEYGNVEALSSSDFIACHRKAMALGLLPEVSSV